MQDLQPGLSHSWSIVHLWRYILASENNEENLIEETEIESTEEVVTVEQFEPELVTDSAVTEEVVTVENDVSEFVTEQSFKIWDILMVQRKTLHWPCKVI